MRRSDNAVIGLIWGRNHDYGDPLERVRLTYFTPMVDILKDVRENVSSQVAEETVLFPTNTKIVHCRGRGLATQLLGHRSGTGF